MATRVTQTMMNTQLLRNITNNIKRMNDLQQQLATGMRINVPSDDPVGITYSLRYRSELAANEQYRRNSDSALSSLDFLDTILGQANDMMQRVRELAVRSASSTNPQSALDAIKAEVEEMYNQLVDIANSKFNGKYIFNGQKTDRPPYSSGQAETDLTDSALIHYEIGPGLLIPINVGGNDVFGDPGEANNMFQIMKDLIQNLENADYEAIGDSIELIDQRLDILLNTRGTVGARINRIQLVQSRLDDIELNLRTLQTEIEGADIPQVLIHLKMSENVYQASLSVGARLIRPSLVDFLR